MELEPPINRNMRDLDRAFFKKGVPVIAAQIEARQTGELLKASVLRPHILDLPKITNVVRTNDGDEGKRLLLLGTSGPGAFSFGLAFGLCDTKQVLDHLPSEVKEYLNSKGATLVSHSIELDYDYWTADQILRAVLPPELGEGSPTAFSINGHIGRPENLDSKNIWFSPQLLHPKAHMNLRDEYLPYRFLIGQVILDVCNLYLP
jgi:tRNA (guanine37-N1)-methyltransferase